MVVKEFVKEKLVILLSKLNYNCDEIYEELSALPDSFVCEDSNKIYLCIDNIDRKTYNKVCKLLDESKENNEIVLPDDFNLEETLEKLNNYKKSKSKEKVSSEDKRVLIKLNYNKESVLYKNYIKKTINDLYSHIKNVLKPESNMEFSNHLSNILKLKKL